MYKAMEFNELRYNTSRDEKTVYNVFAPSKMHEPKSGSLHVEFTNFFGQRQVIHCKTRPQFKQASAFLGMLKRESTTINQICAQYAVKNGKFQNISRLKADLIQAGLTPKAVRLLTVLK
jgi:hypothetical protein